MITVMKETNDDNKRREDNIDGLLTRRIIGACYDVHNALGPGFVERTYLQALKLALEKEGLNCVAEKSFQVSFEGKQVGFFRSDLLIENKVIVELKSLEGSIPKLYESQVLSYLKAAKLKVGLLVNFGNRKCVVRRLLLSP